MKTYNCAKKIDFYWIWVKIPFLSCATGTRKCLVELSEQPNKSLEPLVYNNNSTTKATAQPKTGLRYGREYRINREFPRERSHRPFPQGSQRNIYIHKVSLLKEKKMFVTFALSALSAAPPAALRV